ncbi:MAG TPA: hypothetical protein VFO77_00475 [Actinoplanes sp.]|nr:hypothetical protein [Actinoplanes sp.]
MTRQIDPAAGTIIASAISQSVRTPLHSMLGFLELLSASELSAQGRSLVRDARAQGEALLQAGDRVAALVKVLADPRPGPAERFDIKHLLAEVAATADPASPPSTEVDPYLPTTVQGDAEALRRALLGLTECAVQRGGRDVRLSVERTNTFTDRSVRIRATVRWQGAGLTAAELTALTTDAAPTGAEDPWLLLTNRMIRRLGAQLAVTELRRQTVLNLDVDLRADDWRPSSRIARPPNAVVT